MWPITVLFGSPVGSHASCPGTRSAGGSGRTTRSAPTLLRRAPRRGSLSPSWLGTGAAQRQEDGFTIDFSGVHGALGLPTACLAQMLDADAHESQGRRANQLADVVQPF